jgi:hypothetical protein
VNLNKKEIFNSSAQMVEIENHRWSEDSIISFVAMGRRGKVLNNVWALSLKIHFILPTKSLYLQFLFSLFNKVWCLSLKFNFSKEGFMNVLLVRERLIQCGNV